MGSVNCPLLTENSTNYGFRACRYDIDGPEIRGRAIQIAGLTAFSQPPSISVQREMAGHEVAGIDLSKGWFNALAFVFGMGAAGPKAAATRRIKR